MAYHRTHSGLLGENKNDLGRTEIINLSGCPDGRLFLLHSLVVIHFRQLCSSTFNVSFPFFFVKYVYFPALMWYDVREVSFG